MMAIQAIIIGLPLIADTIISEMIIKDRMPETMAGFAPEFSIEKIGVSRTLIRNIGVGRDVHADLAELSYEWEGIKNFQLNKVIVKGVTLSARIDDSNHIHFNGLDFPIADQNKPSTPQGRLTKEPSFPITLDIKSFLPFIPKQLIFKNVNLNIKYKTRDIRIPIEIMARIHAEQGRATAQVRLIPFGQVINTIISADLESGLTGIQVAGNQLSPDCLTGLFRENMKGLRLAGPMDLNLTKTPSAPWQFELSGLGVSGENLPHLRFDSLKGRLSSVPKQSGGSALNLTADGNITLSDKRISKTSVRFNLATDLLPGKPLALSLKAETLPMDRLVINDGPKKTVVLDRPKLNLTLKGTLEDQECRIHISGQSLVVGFNSDFAKARGLTLTAVIQGNFMNPGQSKTLSFNSTLRGVSLKNRQATAALKHVRASGSFQIQQQEYFPLPLSSGQVKVTAKDISAAESKHKVFWTGMNITAKIRPGNTKKKMRIDLNSAISGIQAVSGTNQVSTQKASASGLLLLDEKLTPSLRMEARIINTEVKVPDHKLSGSEIDVQLPITYPFKPDTKPGKLTIGHISDGRSLDAGFDATLTQTGDLSYAVNGRVTSRNIKGLVFDLDLNAGLDDTMTPEADLIIRSDHFSFTEAELAEIMPEMDIPGQFSVTASTQTHASFKTHVLNTGGRIHIHEGSLDLPDLDLMVQGITGAIEFTDLLNPESLPGQKIKIKSINAGQFQFNDANLRFSIEDGKSLNIENLQFKWCNGLVSTESIRLPDKDNRLSLTLYCDRLEMDNLLRQIGAFDAEGGGTLNGRIPVVYDNGDITFDNGFLFSTPGQGGRIFVNDLDRMMQGFPKDTPEFSQLDLAGEALKDFQYQWAKLQFNTRGDTLDVKMELDGKPAKILPFEYRKDLNSFMRVDAKSPGSRFQGVKLDVNLKLPFNRVMKFGNKLKDILE